MSRGKRQEGAAVGGGAVGWDFSRRFASVVSVSGSGNGDGSAGLFGRCSGAGH